MRINVICKKRRLLSPCKVMTRESPLFRLAQWLELSLENLPSWSMNASVMLFRLSKGLISLYKSREILCNPRIILAISWPVRGYRSAIFSFNGTKPTSSTLCKDRSSSGSGEDLTTTMSLSFPITPNTSRSNFPRTNSMVLPSCVALFALSESLFSPNRDTPNILLDSLSLLPPVASLFSPAPPLRAQNTIVNHCFSLYISRCTMGHSWHLLTHEPPIFNI